MRRERTGVCLYGDMAEGGGAGGSTAERGEENEEGKSAVERGGAERGEEVQTGRTRGITRRGKVERSEEALERDFILIGVVIGTSRMAIVFIFSLRRRFCQ